MAAQTIQDSQGRPYEVVRLTSPQSLPGYKTIQSPDGSYIAVKPLYSASATGQAASSPTVDALTDLAKTAGTSYAKDAILGSGSESVASEALVGPVAPSIEAGTLAGPAAMEGGFGSLGLGPQAAVLAGTALTGKGIYDLAKNKKGDPLSRGVTAMSTFGLSEIARGLGLGGKKSTKEIQAGRDNDLVEKNITGYKDYLAQRGKTDKGYVNNKFANSRLESDLRVEDTVGGNQNFELVGNDYLGKWNEEQRNRFNQMNLDAGNVREKKGGLYFNDEAKAKSYMDLINQGSKSPTLPHSSPSVQSTPAVTPIQRPIATPAVDTKDSRLNLLSKVAESQKKKLSGFSKLYE
jgi:hypothetical protein